MAKMIPDYIDQENPNLNGERMVFEWLSSPSVSGVAMHSLLQKNHRRKMIGEVDFLYISKRGILCFEVKGGKVYRENGLWYSIGKNDKVNDIKDPFRQAKDCMYAVKSYLENTYGKFSAEANCLMGYAVVFPECIFRGSGNDLMTEIMFDGRRNLSDFPEYIEDTFEFWKCQENEKHNFTPEVLTEVQVKKYTDLFRGDFHVVPSMNLEMQHIDKKMLELTEEQYDALDITLSNKKVVIQGVAGTGKSLLAIEKARKMIASNKKVAYICFNRNMAKYAIKAFEGISEGSFVGTYHSLIMQQSGISDLHNFSVVDISRILINTSDILMMFDCLIVDEAQDLLFVEVMESLNRMLRGGMEQGEWVMFLDPNQNIFNYSQEYAFAWDYLVQVYGPVIFTLSNNCRNTEQIGRRTSAVTMVPPAKHMKISGPKVVMKTYSSNAEFLRYLRTELISLISGGTPLEDIVLLSKYRLENSALRGKDSICNLTIVEPTDITQFRKKALNYFTIQSFKGLESKVVFLLDVDGFETVQNRMLNYVGMSRAKILLYCFVPQESVEEYIEVTGQN